MRGEATRLSIAVRWTTAIPWLRRAVGSTWDFDVTTMGMSMSMIWMLSAFWPLNFHEGSESKLTPR